MMQTKKQHGGVMSDKKRRLLDILREMGIMCSDFTGRITLNINQGSVCDIEKFERFK